MRAAVALLVLLAACGDDAGGAVDGGSDAPTDGPDLPPDPFAGMFDSPDDFPRTGCRPGALAGFARAGLWLPLQLRTDVDGGGLHTFVPADIVDEVEVPHLLTADDLVVRHSVFYPGGSGWNLTSLAVCDVLADGTLIGHRVFCYESQGTPMCVPPSPFRELPLIRIVGEDEAAGGLTLVGELALEGRPVNVRVADGVAYLPMLVDGMRIVSVADPAAPAKLGWWVPAEANFYNDVKLMTAGGRRYAVLAGAPSDVIDVTDPASPQLAAHLPVGAHTLDVEGTTAYLVGGDTNDLTIIDLAVPTAPVVRARFDDPMVRGVHDLHVVDGVAYLSAPYVGLAVVDCRDPSAPVTVAVARQDRLRYWHSPWRTEIAGKPVVVHGDEGPDGRLTLLDLDPVSPTYLGELGSWQLRRATSLHNLVARGDRAYVAHYQDGIRVLDLSNPAAPAPLAYFNTWSNDHAVAAFYSGAFGLQLDAPNRRLYVADSQRGLLILAGSAALIP